MVLKRQRWYRFLVVLSFLGLQNAGWAQTAKAYAQLDTNEMLIGDRMTLSLRINFGNYEQLVSTLPIQVVDTADGFEVIDNGAWTAVPLRDGQALEKKVVFTVWDTGLYRISSFLIQIQTQIGDKYAIESPNCWLTVRHPDGVEAMAGPVGIKDIKEEPLEWSDIWPYIVGFLGIFLLLTGLWQFIKWRKNRKKEIIIPEIVRPPHEIALEKWAALSPEICIDEATTKYFYSELSYILREYIEKRFNIQALENTTEALLTLVDQYNQMDFSEEILAAMRRVLQTADLVKFAKVVPPASQNSQVYGDVHRVITETQVRPIEPENGSETSATPSF